MKKLLVAADAKPPKDAWHSIRKELPRIHRRRHDCKHQQVGGYAPAAHDISLLVLDHKPLP
ncbi:hypothetical protein [Belnapia rosea]|uniref:hypothetical protein n=1 Tax=Belnapia rosea TaxID=938405 RepID=UPI0015A22622|nr:hypothetical protein [Belnapia rosea]